jgi:type II secretion system protein N
MSNWRRGLLIGAGYLSVFSLVFIVSIYFTFDANALKPMIVREAGKRKINLEIQDMGLKGFMGLRIKGLKIAPLESESGGEESGPGWQIDRLDISPRLSTITGLISALGSGKKGGGLGSLAFSFEVRIGGGKISGSFEQGQDSLSLEARVADLPLERIPLNVPKIKNLALTGRMNGQVSLEMEDRKRPDTWNGKTEVDLDNLEASDFEAIGLKVGGFTVGKGTLIADIESGTASINPLKLQGGDITATLSGTMALKPRLIKSILDLKGPFKFSEEYKEKNPLISGFLPSSDNYSYKGTLEGMMAGM